jgi:tetratricopeptide (TPR) repeat protein
MEEEVLVSKAETLVRKHSRSLLYGVAAVALAAGLWVAVETLWRAPREQAAAEELFRYEGLFRADSFRLALDGFEAIADQYGSTRSGDLAKGYAGICAFRVGDYELAVKYLKGYSAHGDAAAVTTGLLGDAYANLDRLKDAIRSFEKAATLADNADLSALYLKKAAAAYESLEDYKGAIKAYSRIQTDYVTSRESEDIDKYITRAELLWKEKSR